MHFCFLLPGGNGHLNPMLALTVELKKREHQVTFFATQDTLKAGVEVIECAAAVKIRLNFGVCCYRTTYYVGFLT